MSRDRRDASRALRARGTRRRSSPYLTAGDPDLDVTPRRSLRAPSTAGADLIELGVPFSDPMADGPVIQRAAERALAGGHDARRACSSWSRELRARARDVPIVLFGYYNPFFRYGVDALARDAAAAGVDGVAVRRPAARGGGRAARGASRRHGLDLILLLAPTTPPARVRHDRPRRRAASSTSCRCSA